MNYGKLVSNKRTPQSEKIPGSNQVQNSAGGFSYEVTDAVRLDRFLVLGSEGGNYYASERKLTQDNAAAVIREIKRDGLAVVRKVVEVSDSGRAPKNDPAIFVMALAITYGDDATKREVVSNLSRVCRTGTHVLTFASICNELRGWGRALKNAVAGWYTSKSADSLAYQVAKYQQRNGWSHRDLLRLVHPQVTEQDKQTVLRWVTRGAEQLGNVDVKRGERNYSYAEVGPLPRILEGFEKAKRATTEKEIVQLITDYNLPRECIPTQFLNAPAVWAALLEKMPLTAMIRNLGKMTSIGLLSPLSNATSKVRRTLDDAEVIGRSRIHPLSILTALRTYAAGRGVKGSLTWQPDQLIVDGLNEAFYTAFKSVKPTNKRIMLALDVSGSMGGAYIAGSHLTARDGSAAMALVTAKTESNYHIVGFTSSGGNYNYWKNQNGLSPLSISPKQRLDSVIKSISGLPFGGTDCSLPAVYAMNNKIPVDAFVIYTDSETWAGSIHPSQAIKQYRQQMGIDAKLIVVGMTANNFSIADPNDAGMFDVVGFDTATPNLISDFIRGEESTDNHVEEEPDSE
jgi:60 kDa SS-A/Ro ribonucleoprotein